MLVILLGGGTKVRQGDDIKLARLLWQEYKEKKTEKAGPLTHPFSETVRECLEESADFRKALLREAVGCMLTGEIVTGKSLLRQYVNGTVGFIALGKALGRSPKTLMQMLGPKGNPHIKNFFEIVAYLQKIEGRLFEWQDQDAA